MGRARIDIPLEDVQAFCRKWRVRELALFGSALRDDFGPESDIDLLVEFEQGPVPGLFRFARIERELAELFGGRRVELLTAGDLSQYFRDEVVATAEALYAEA